MKIFFPKNISGGRLNLSVQIWPATISIVQMLLLAVGLGFGMWLRNLFVRNGASKLIAFMLAIPIFLIFVLIAFFKYSELRLHEFIAKMIRTYFLDVTRKFQVKYARPDPIRVAIAKAKASDRGVIITQKDLVLDENELDRLSF